VQGPDAAVAPGMPRSALAYVAVDYTLPLASMGPLLGRLAAAVAEGAEHMPDDTPETASADHGVLDVTDGGAGTPAPSVIRGIRQLCAAARSRSSGRAIWYTSGIKCAHG